MIRINVHNRLINSLFRYTWGYDWHSWTNLKGIPIIRKGEMLLYKGLEGKFRKHTIDLKDRVSVPGGQNTGKTQVINY